MTSTSRAPLRRRPLDGVRVLAVEQYGAGPWATLQLADLGAEVIKIEDPGSRGDIGRYVPPFQEGEDSLFFETFNRNKKSLSLDLRHPSARKVFQDLARAADVVFSNLRGDQPERLGLTFVQLSPINPRIVCCSLSAFGMTGPRAREGGYDYTMQGLAGWMSLTGGPGSPPTKSGLSLVDFSGGYVAAIAILAGVMAARRDGVGCDCDISLYETALAELSYIATWVATAGYVPERVANSAHPSIVPFQNFATSDGWLVVACAKPKFWALLVDVLGRPDLAADVRFRDMPARYADREALLSILQDAFLQRPTDEWLQRLTTAGVPCARVNDVAAALDDAQAQFRNAIVTVEHPTFGSVRQVASPLRVGEPAPAPTRAPSRGEHTEEVLRALCRYSKQQIQALADAGVFGQDPAPEVQL
jgi:crotonobetainyl-CoA:carnitine CoA-transferase CaiB-like acyl-CoA transferase